MTTPIRLSVGTGEMKEGSYMDVYKFKLAPIDPLIDSIQDHHQRFQSGGAGGVNAIQSRTTTLHLQITDPALR